MKKHYALPILLFGLLSCKTTIPTSSDTIENNAESPSTAFITFGSCNKYEVENVFWDDILALEPDVFIWGGDNIYADTDDMQKLRAMYDAQRAIPAYAALMENVFITGTWDDHDYGLNDGGVEFRAKQESQQEFLDFLDVAKSSPRRTREGVYSSQLISKPAGVIKVINLDTRYFRDGLTNSSEKGKRYEANPYGQSSVLGDAQWAWLVKELKKSKADFNLIVTSIQFLSNTHGFEKWANFPHEVDKMTQLLKESQAKGVIFLSGDRHISEFSKRTIDGLEYPIIDFTSSGLTHAYNGFTGEPNPYRTGEVVFTTSFGLLELDLETKEATFKMMGDNGEVLQQMKQQY